MKLISCGRYVLSLLVLFGVLSASLGDESTSNPSNDGTATMTPTDQFELNDLLGDLENGDSFVENYIMGKPEFYREEYDPVSAANPIENVLHKSSLCSRIQ